MTDSPEKVETRKLQLAGTGERLIISNSYNRHNARYRCSPVPARKLKKWQESHPHLFVKSVYNETKPDTERDNCNGDIIIADTREIKFINCNNLKIEDKN